MIKFLPKVLDLLNNVKMFVDIAIPVVERIIGKDLNNDGKIG